MKNLSQKETTEIRDLFNLFDTSGNGYVNKNDVRIVLNSLGHNITDGKLQLCKNKCFNLSCYKEMANKMMKHLDTNGDDRIDVQAFIEMMDSLKSFLSENPVFELRNALKLESLFYNKVSLVKLIPLEYKLVI